MTPCRLVHSYGSIFTNMNGVTALENILVVITGIRITSLIRNIISRWLLGALPRNLNQTHTLLQKYVTFNSEYHFSSAAVLIMRTETLFFFNCKIDLPVSNLGRDLNLCPMPVRLRVKRSTELIHGTESVNM